jgi:hypothetical protein
MKLDIDGDGSSQQWENLPRCHRRSRIELAWGWGKQVITRVWRQLAAVK